MYEKLHHKSSLACFITSYIFYLRRPGTEPGRRRQTPFLHRCRKQVYKPASCSGLHLPVFGWCDTQSRLLILSPMLATGNPDLTSICSHSNKQRLLFQSECPWPTARGNSSSRRSSRHCLMLPPLASGSLQFWGCQDNDKSY